MSDEPTRLTEPQLRDYPPGLYYVTHTAHNNPDAVDRLTQDVVLKPRPPKDSVFTDDFDDPELMYEFFESADSIAGPPTQPPIILSAERFERRNVKISRLGFEVHTFVLYSATLALPDSATGLPDFTRCHAIVQLVTDGNKGDLVNVDSVARVEDGVQRDQTWQYVRDEKGDPKVFQTWQWETEDDGAERLEERSVERSIREMRQHVGPNADRRERELDKGEQTRMEIVAKRDARLRHGRQVVERIDREFAEKVQAKSAAAQIDHSDKDSHMAMTGTEETPASAISLLATVAAQLQPLPHIPYTPVVPSPLPVADDLRDVGPTQGPPKTTLSQGIAFADPNDHYRPRPIDQAQPHETPHIATLTPFSTTPSSDSEQIDQLADDSPPPSYTPHSLYPSISRRHKSQALASSAYRSRRNVETRGHMLLRSGKVTGVGEMLKNPHEFLRPLPSTFTPTFVPMEVDESQDPVSTGLDDSPPSPQPPSSPPPPSPPARLRVREFFDQEQAGNMQDYLDDMYDDSSPHHPDRDGAPSPSTPSDLSSLYYPSTPDTTTPNSPTIVTTMPNDVQDDVVMHGLPTPPPEESFAHTTHQAAGSSSHIATEGATDNGYEVSANNPSSPLTNEPLDSPPTLGDPARMYIAPTSVPASHHFPYVETVPNSPEDMDIASTASSLSSSPSSPSATTSPRLPPLEVPLLRDLDAFSAMDDASTTPALANSLSSTPSLTSVSTMATLATTDAPPTSESDLSTSSNDSITTLPTAPASGIARAVHNHQFHLPLVSTRIASLAVSEKSFEPPFGTCPGDTPTPTSFTTPVLQPLRHHIQLRRHYCYVLEYASLVALDKGLNLYLQHLRTAFSQENLLKYHDCYHIRSEWAGNPFLFAIERFRLTQILQFFDDIDPRHDNKRLSSLCELVEEVLGTTIPLTDWQMIARQRLAGYYGPPYAMPVNV